MKAKIASINLKGTDSPNKEIELFNQIQFISVRIKAAGGTNQLEADQEYIALISRHLSTKQLEDWVKRDVEDWDSFYSYLEELSNESRKLRTMKN